MAQAYLFYTCSPLNPPLFIFLSLLSFAFFHHPLHLPQFITSLLQCDLMTWQLLACVCSFLPFQSRSEATAMKQGSKPTTQRHQCYKNKIQTYFQVTAPKNEHLVTETLFESRYKCKDTDYRFFLFPSQFLRIQTDFSFSVTVQ